MSDDKIVCNCLNITTEMIKDAIDAGASTLEEVQEETGAGTICGACCDEIQHIIEKYVNGQNK